MGKLPYHQALSWLGAVMAAVAISMTFLFTTFQTNAEADKFQSTVQQQLNRLDNKLDKILEQTK